MAGARPESAALTSALDDTKQQLDLAEARGHLLDARVSLYNVNFGDASRQFEEAKAPLRRVQDRYQTEGKKAAADSIAAALERCGGRAAPGGEARSDSEREGRGRARRDQARRAEVTLLRDRRA